MKNINIVLFWMVCGLIAFNGCKKDEEKPSSPGYFTLEGKQYELGKAYYDYADIMKDPYSNKEFLQHGVYFTSNDITIENGIVGKGGVVSIQFMDPSKAQIPAPGEYSFQTDAMAVKSYTYFDFSFGYLDNSTVKQVNLTTIHDAIVMEAKSGDNYEFSSSGKTTDGKNFEFYYKGTLTLMTQ